MLALGNQPAAGPAGFCPSIARLSVSGIDHRRPQMQELIDKLAKADQVKAVIIDINSPGGTTTGGEAMYDAVRRLAEKKPVVAVCGTLATSAGLYRGARHRPHLRLRQHHHRLGRRDLPMGRRDASSCTTLGIKVEEVKSGDLKAVPSPFEPTDEKARALSEEMVQEAKVWFVGLVAKTPRD